MLGFLTAVLVVPQPRVALRTTSQKASPAFARSSSDSKKAKAVWIDGRDTDLRVPESFRVDERSNRRGDLAGEFMDDFSGASSGTWYYPFLKPRDAKFRLLPFPPHSDNPSICDLDAHGRVLTVDSPPSGEIWSGLANHYPRAYLWSGVAWTDLGATDDARFLKNGAVFGYFWADAKGRPFGPEGNSQNARKVWFRWQGSRRTLFHK